jgi:Recombination endonuclease VII
MAYSCVATGMSNTEPRKGRRSACRIDAKGRECTQCHHYKVWDEFFKSRPRQPGGRTSKCKDCWRESYPTWEHTEESLLCQSLALLSLTPDEYRALLELQGYTCALCRTEETWKHPRTGKLYRLAVDHDHTCHPKNKACKQCIRGLLCRNCNRMIGHAEQAGPLVTVRFADYMERRPLLEGGGVHA